MMTEIDKIAPEIVVAVDWWANRAGSNVNKMDNMGDTPREYRTQSDDLASVLAMTIATNRPIPGTAQLAKFKEVLTEQLLKEWNHDSSYVVLSVDYGPDAILTKALKVSLIEVMLPWKTQMWLEHGSVKVSEGYGAKPLVLYPSPVE